MTSNERAAVDQIVQREGVADLLAELAVMAFMKKIAADGRADTEAAHVWDTVQGLIDAAQSACPAWLSTR